MSVIIPTNKTTIFPFSTTFMLVTPPFCRPEPVNCRPAHVHSCLGPVTNCGPEPLCVVTDIPKCDTSYKLQTY